jgi:hypothetical protein
VAGPASDDARAAGERVEAILAEIADADPKVGYLAEELVTCLVQLYGAGLATIMRLISGDDRLAAQLIADPLVESLLLVHDLHPLDTEARIKRALGRLGPGPEFLGLDDDGLVRVKLASGCGHTAAAVGQAITDAAPEIIGVDFAPPDPPLLQIARHRPAGAR